MPHEKSTEITVTPLTHGAEKKTNFGAVVTGADLNDLGETSFEKLRDAVYTHNIIILKGQQDVLPAKQFEFVHRFDPDARPKHGFGTGKGVKELGDLGKKPFYGIPGAGGVTVVGHGYQGEDHYGLKEVTLDAISHVDFHKDPLSTQELASGFARFVEWHFDGIIHASHPSRITTFRCIKAPRGPDITVLFDDGTNRSMRCTPGSTAFISGAQIYDLLTEKEKETVDNSYWEPAPHPFAWYGTRRRRPTGLGLVSGGETVPLNELPEWSPADVYKYPLIWINPVTGEKSFQVMPELVRKLHLRDSFDAAERVVDDEEEIRIWFNNIFDRIMSPEYILTLPAEEGDMVVWNNWGLMHSAIEYPLSYGPRSMHQCHIASSTAPLGPRDVAKVGVL